MVEGPKVHLKTRKLKVLEGRALRNTFFCASVHFQNALGMIVSEVFCVGKELFIMFSNGVAIRLHFGMDGSERLIPVFEKENFNAGDLLPKHSRKKLSAVLEFDAQSLVLFDTTLSLKQEFEIKIAKNKCARDVMNPFFSHEEVMELLRNDGRPLLEALMDQSILPGVGNIIKCESLFMTSLHPSVAADEVGEAGLRLLIDNLVSFSWEWFNCCRSRKKVNQRVYGLHSCTACDSTITLIRDAVSHRITYFCPSCQQRRAVEHAPQQRLQTPSALTSSIGLLDSKSEAHQGPHKDVPRISGDPQDLHPQGQGEARQANDLPFLRQPCCRCSQAASLQRVRKEGDTHGRLFWSCSRGGLRGGGCSFFAWADDAFPRCKCGRRALLRRVLKPGPTNGKYFFACSSPKGSQCNCFLWCEAFIKAAAAAAVGGRGKEEAGLMGLADGRILSKRAGERPEEGPPCSRARFSVPL